MAEDDLQDAAPQGGDEQTDRRNGNDEPAGAASRSGDGLGFDSLAMNEIAASVTEEPTGELERRRGNRWLIVVAVLAAAAVVYAAGRAVVNLPPGSEAQTRLRGRLMTLESWRNGVVVGARYLSGDTLRVDLSGQLSTKDSEARDTFRKAAREVMEVLIQERPGRDLHIVGFQGEEQILQAEYRQKSNLVGPGGEVVPEILIHVKGDPKRLSEEAGSGSRPRE